METNSNAGDVFSLWPTEAVNPASEGIDAKSSADIVDIIHREDLKAWEAVGRARDAVARVVEQVVRAFKSGGRLVYVGAGTSGRLGVLDASECPPTFGVRPDLVQGVIAGGEGALRSAVEGAEDDLQRGVEEVQKLGGRPHDVVCGIAASGRTPFVWGALLEAQAREATTVLITCNPDWRRTRQRQGIPDIEVDEAIVLDVGPEIIAGSSRLKGGTATKLILNTVSTAAMIRWGRVYDNLMVDLVPVNQKLRARAIRLVCRIAQVEPREATRLLEHAGGQIKVAVLLNHALTPADARKVLARHDGVLRRALHEIAARGGRE